MRKQHLPLFLGIVVLILFLTAALFPCREVSTDEEQDRLIDEFIGELDDDGDK